MTTASRISEDLDKAASMVLTARRLLATGTTVDLGALEGKVRSICERLAAMPREDGRGLVPAMEALIADLDLLAEAVRDRVDPPPPPRPGAYPVSGGRA